MHFTPHQKAVLPLIALQGAVSSFAGFIGYFFADHYSLDGLFYYSALMLTAAVAATGLSYLLGARLRLSGRRLFRLGLILPGLMFLFGGRSIDAVAVAYGAYLGLTWGARHSLEMLLLEDGERDGYASRSGAAFIVAAVLATFAATVILACFAEQSRYVYWAYGALCIAGGVIFGRGIPDTPPVALKDPMAVLRHPQFLACLPLFMLESGLIGVSHALASVGATLALHSASNFGWVATIAGLFGAVALYYTKQNRHINNRIGWLGASCAAVAVSFVFLGMSAWIPAAYVVYTLLKAVAHPFLHASEQVLNQRTLDIPGNLSDRIFARELMLWVLRMVSLAGFWMLARVMPPVQMLVLGSTLLALAAALEYWVGRLMYVRARDALPAREWAAVD